MKRNDISSLNDAIRAERFHYTDEELNEFGVDERAAGFAGALQELE